MFVSRCSSFCSIVPCSFESILTPKSLVQECYMLLTAVTYQNLVICYFCCNWYVHLVHELYKCFDLGHPYLQRCLPCIFVINVVTSTSMQIRLRDNADFSSCSAVIWCHVNMLLQRDPCIFWRCSLRMFCSYSCNWSIPAIVCNFRLP